MRFEKVIPALRAGKKIRRTKWKEDICISIDGKVDQLVRYNFGSVFNFNKSDFENDDWEIVKGTKKVKLRDLTEEQFEKWRKNNCPRHDGYCPGCPFQKVQCDNHERLNDAWYLNKDLYSDKFLDQEIEVEE